MIYSKAIQQWHRVTSSKKKDIFSELRKPFRIGRVLISERRAFVIIISVISDVYLATVTVAFFF
jgi:hypothetical protein